MRSLEVRLSEEWKTEWREEERGFVPPKLERRTEYAEDGNEGTCFSQSQSPLSPFPLFPITCFHIVPTNFPSIPFFSNSLLSSPPSNTDRIPILRLLNLHSPPFYFIPSSSSNIKYFTIKPSPFIFNS